MTTFYINNQPGLGSNSNSGTSEDSPWRDFAPIHQRTMLPGDKILLARGCCWNQQLVINDSGSKDAWCELGAYGTGARPQIIRNGDALERGIRFNNPSYWYIHDLEVARCGTGILIYYNTTGHEGLRLENIYVHDCYGIFVRDMSDGPARVQARLDRMGIASGIMITCEPLDIDPEECIMRDIRMDNIEGAHNADSVSINPGGKSVREQVSYPLQDIVLNRLYLHDDDAPNPGGIPDTLRFVRCKHVLLLNSYLDNECGRYTSSGTAAVFMGGVKDLNFTNCIFTRTPDTLSNDQCAIDFEATTRQVKIRNCYFGQHAGPGVEFLDIWGETSYSENHEVSGNAFEGNGWGCHGGQAGSGGIHHYGGNFATGIIRDNLVYEPGRPLYHGEFINFTLVNNLVASQALFNAMNDFYSVQGQRSWFYQTRIANGPWSNLARYSDDLHAWVSDGDPTDAWVDIMEQCTMLPDATVARTWRAEQAGVVAVRGRAVKLNKEGAPATVQITLNDRVIWGPQSITAGDWDGVETNLDNLVVGQHDLIRFEVTGAANNLTDAVSWAPTVGYIE
ncbi:MAG: hypothetical protein ACYCZF_17070 [Anaerolineae bacterium]